MKQKKGVLFLLTMIVSVLLSIGAWADYETTGKAVMDGKEHTYQLHGKDGEVWKFPLKLTKQGELNGKISSKTGKTLKVTLTDNDGKIIKMEKFGAVSTNSISSPAVVCQSLAAGDYYLYIESQQKGAESLIYDGVFGLTLSYTSYGVAYHPKDTFDHPIQTLTDGTSVSGAVSWGNAHDYYAISVPKKQKISISMTAITHGRIAYLLWNAASETSNKLVYEHYIKDGEQYKADVELEKGTYVLEIFYTEGLEGDYTHGGKYSIVYKGPYVAPVTGFTVNNITYQVTNQSKKTVTAKKFTSTSATSVEIPKTVKYKGVTYQVTKIGASFAKNHTSLKKVVVRANVTTIGKKAFYGCKNLKSVRILSTKLKTVGTGAFKGIKKKAVIYVPKTKYAAYRTRIKKSGLGSKVKINKK